MPAVSVFEILPNPSLDIGDLWERVARRLLARVELGESDAETELIDICVGDDVVGSSGDRRVDQELDQALGSERPAFGVAVDERLGVAESLCEGDYGCLAVGGTGELLRVGEDDGQVDGLEDAVAWLAGDRIESRRFDLLMLDLVGDTDEEIRTKPLVLSR